MYPALYAIRIVYSLSRSGSWLLHSITTANIIFMPLKVGNKGHLWPGEGGLYVNTSLSRQESTKRRIWCGMFTQLYTTYASVGALKLTRIYMICRLRGCVHSNMQEVYWVWTSPSYHSNPCSLLPWSPGDAHQLIIIFSINIYKL
jgi:hypothetical protein